MEQMAGVWVLAGFTLKIGMVQVYRRRIRERAGGKVDFVE